MLLRNRSVGAGGKQSDRGLVNGSRGVVVAFTESAEGGDRGQVPVVRFELPQFGTRKCASHSVGLFFESFFCLS